MASSSPALKSQPLHNFQLHDLKWAMNHTNTQRLRKLSDSESDETRKRNQLRQPPSEKNNGSCSNVQKTTPSDGSRSKIFIRLRTKNNQKPVDEVLENGDHSLNVEDVQDFVPKTWNLRPRKPIPNPKIQSSSAQRPESSRSRNVTEPKPADKKPKKLKFSVSLTREEIDDDIFAMTGSKASRRPKKRPKNVQKQLDYVFPGLWLASITPDCYKVPEPPLKG